jgi:hypothetical protein
MITVLLKAADAVKVFHGSLLRDSSAGTALAAQIVRFDLTRFRPLQTIVVQNDYGLNRKADRCRFNVSQRRGISCIAKTETSGLMKHRG